MYLFLILSSPNRFMHPSLPFLVSATFIRYTNLQYVADNHFRTWFETKIGYFPNTIRNTAVLRYRRTVPQSRYRLRVQKRPKTLWPRYISSQITMRLNRYGRFGPIGRSYTNRVSPAVYVRRLTVTYGRF